MPAEDYTNMSYYNLCGIRSQHSNISKRKKGGVLIKKMRVNALYIAR
jgi:hypothetical protein